jgi:carboxyl-terminal processing protease
MNLSWDRKLLVGVSGLVIALTLFGGTFSRSAANDGTIDYLKVFNEVLYLSMNNYVEAIQMDSLMEGAYRGMLETLDPNNEYLGAADYQKASKGDAGGPADVGLRISKRHGYVVVMSSVPGSPAADAGLKTSDVLLTIDGHTTRMLGAWAAERMLRGKNGSTVVLGISPSDGGDRKDVTLTRRATAAPAPSGRLAGKDVGVVRVLGLREGDARRLDQTIATLKNQGIKRLLLDLRGCSSESLPESIGTASLFVTDGVVVTIADRHDGDKSYKADGRKRAWSGPMAVLVDESTSRSCEMMAAALRDDLGAPLLGQKTWGVGTVTSLLPLPSGDGVFLATGLMQSPSGKLWNGKGLDPDFVIEGDPADSDDPQRQKAVDYLRGMAMPSSRQAA